MTLFPSSKMEASEPKWVNPVLDPYLEASKYKYLNKTKILFPNIYFLIYHLKKRSWRSQSENKNTSVSIEHPIAFQTLLMPAIFPFFGFVVGKFARKLCLIWAGYIQSWQNSNKFSQCVCCFDKICFTPNRTWVFFMTRQTHQS